ncbi:MAG: CDP-alcohol phosphatidyltransferase family protein [Rhodothermales bacterium]
MKFVPNAITIARIVLTPILLVMMMSNTLFGLGGALVLFIIAAITDYFDGKLARALGVRSRLGQFLDPFADKVLVLGTFTALAFLIPEIVPWWAVALIALRDVVVTVLRMWEESRGRTLRTVPMAKTKTTLQLIFLIGILVLLTAGKLRGAVAEAALWVLESAIPFILLMVVVALTVFTGLWYLFNKEYVSPAQFNG